MIFVHIQISALFHSYCACFGCTINQNIFIPVHFQNSSSSPPLAITNKLNRIHSNLLANNDVELFHHLNRLEIIPQVYGL